MDNIVFENNFAKIIFDRKNPYILEIQLVDGIFLNLSIASACDTIYEHEHIGNLNNAEHIKHDGYDELILAYSSSLWQDKTYHIILQEDYIEYYYTFCGTGKIDKIRYFETIIKEKYKPQNLFSKHFNDKKETAYREFSLASTASFKKIFSPEVASYCKYIFNYFENTQISANSDLDYLGGNFATNPPFLSFLFGVDQKKWHTFGLAVKPGEHHFTEYHYEGGESFGLSLNYWGYPLEQKKFVTPSMIICSGDGHLDTYSKYKSILKRKNLIPIPNTKDIPNWWLEPLIAGYGHQSYTTDLLRVRSTPDRPSDLSTYHSCTQAFYEDFLRKIDKHNLPWRTLVIDPRWFSSPGRKVVDTAKWPDMRGFIDSLHDRGKKVTIWWGFWEREGLDKDLCITFKASEQGKRKNREGRFYKFGGIPDGGKMAPDPGLSKWKEEVEKMLYLALSSDSGCLNADGLKIDHVAGVPGLYGMHYSEESKKIRGIELLKYMHEIVYKTAKSIKSDVFISGQSPNPYFSDVLDGIRLGDAYTPEFSVVNEMKFRSQLAKLAIPEIVLETDQWPIPSLNALMEYVDCQHEIGVPCLYYATHIDTTSEELRPENIDKIREAWVRYLKDLPFHSTLLDV